MNEKVKDWYNLMYPSDELGMQLRGGVTFNDVWNNIESVYDVLDVSDSLVRERVFESIADRLSIGYGVVYTKWLGL